jgi:hypothetical protein
MRVHGCSTIVLGLLFLSAGCSGGGADNFGTAKAGGKVTYDGKPVTGASIMFAPTGAAGAEGMTTGKAASGELDANGEFTLSTYADGDGAVIGKHKVVLSEADPAMPLPGTVKAGLELEVKAGENNHFEIQLEPRAAPKSK